MLKAKLVLKTGKTLNVVVQQDRTFSAKSFTEETVQSFITTNGAKVIVQGNNIDYLEIYQ